MPAVLLIAALACRADAQTPFAYGPATLGINVLFAPDDEASLQTRFDAVRALGLTLVRIDWMWRVVEPRKGRTDWTAMDRLVRVAHRAHVQLLPVVHYAPDWALAFGRKTAATFEMAPDETAFDAYARFLEASVRRYGPGGDAPVAFDPIVSWEIWNEPNIAEFWAPEPDAPRFARLMETVAARLKPYRDRIKLVHGGLSNADTMFLWKLFEVDKTYGDTFDVLSVHPYLFDGKDGVRQPADMDADVPAYAARGFVGNPTKPDYLGKVFNLALLMRMYGAGKPIWITETGFFVSGKWLGVNEREQADRMRTTLDFIRDRLTSTPYGQGGRSLPADVQRVYWFALQDFPSPVGYGNFGMFRADGSMRPSGAVLQGYAMPP